MNQSIDVESTSAEGADLESASPSAATVVNWSVPYIHQICDTEDTFNGINACGPTSAVMVLAAFQRLVPNPITISTTPCGPAHTSSYGFYVTREYSIRSVQWGSKTFDRQQE